MALSDISSSEAVEAAIREYEQVGQGPFLQKYGFKKAQSYFLDKDGRLFDSKAIIGAAHGYQFPEQGPLKSSEFSGGEATVGRKLQELGFEVRVGDVGSSKPEQTPDTDLSASPAIWVEKTIVTNRADRIAGEFALGKMLWSPQSGSRGADIYRFMREVRPGDVVLHLTDNEGFTGVSVADAAAEEFNGVSNTNWSDRPSYFVRLRDYRKLDPTLHRDKFLRNSGFRDRMLGLLSSGLKNTFYAADGNLNQGQYLTPAPPSLINILNDAYRQVAGKELVPGISTEGDANVRGPVSTTPSATVDLKGIVTSFAQALRESHINFGNRHEEVVRTFLASLAAKRFVILTGLSGSGKTQLAIRFGEWLGAGHSRVIPVRPDWTGPEQLLGYEDALLPLVGAQRGWFVPDALSFILKAAGDPATPYLLVLDEMNLAHVERYFADVLSGMESDEACIPNLVKEKGTWLVKVAAPDKIPFPDNLFLVGTVNVDETTYAFSPKVLDRANTLEFRVSATDLDPHAQKPRKCQPGPDNLVSRFLEVSRDSNWHLSHVPAEFDTFKSHLFALHTILADGGFEFGHRVFYEAIRFASIINAAGVGDSSEALDLFVLQKILPRLHGSRRNLEPTLNALEGFARDPNAIDANRDPVTAPTLRRSHVRIVRFKRILNANQFASFSD